MKTIETIKQKLRSAILCLEAHPDNEPHSEFADRIDDLNELRLLIHEYALEAIKADRERVVSSCIEKYMHDSPVMVISKNKILNLPIELS